MAAWRMRLNAILPFATLFTMVIAVASVGFAILSHRWQTNATIYLNLSERLHKMYGTIPNEVRTAHLTGAESPDYESPLAAVLVLNYLNLMHSAFLLYKSGYFSGRLWRSLSAEAELGLGLPVARVQWAKLRTVFASNPGFVKYVDAVQMRRVGTRG